MTPELSADCGELLYRAGAHHLPSGLAELDVGHGDLPPNLSVTSERCPGAVKPVRFAPRQEVDRVFLPIVVEVFVEGGVEYE
jgi:hypothetical protein